MNFVGIFWLQPPLASSGCIDNAKALPCFAVLARGVLTDEDDDNTLRKLL